MAREKPTLTDLKKPPTISQFHSPAAGQVELVQPETRVDKTEQSFT
jgi:hypothetical protein